MSIIFIQYVYGFCSKYSKKVRAYFDQARHERPYQVNYTDYAHPGLVEG
jgi:hypothetical protein